MTPKQKAEEIVDKMYNVDLMTFDEQAMQYPYAKKCALIAVEEIVKEIQANEFEYFARSMPNVVYLYWQEVKQEIEKL